MFFVVDRVKELIKYKGYQVAPAELEALLLTHPGGRRRRGGADARTQRAARCPRRSWWPTARVDTDELMAWVAERVAPYKRIRAVEFIETIPKSPSGKILRRVLRATGEKEGP